MRGYDTCGWLQCADPSVSTCEVVTAPESFRHRATESDGSELLTALCDERGRLMGSICSQHVK